MRIETSFSSVKYNCSKSNVAMTQLIDFKYELLKHPSYSPHVAVSLHDFRLMMGCCKPCTSFDKFSKNHTPEMKYWLTDGIEIQENSRETKVFSSVLLLKKFQQGLNMHLTTIETI